MTSSTRHPLDPDPVRATKASAVFGLGLLSVVTGPFGARRLRSGVRLAWTGIVLAIAGLVVLAIIGLLHYARQRGTDFDPTVN